MAAQTWNDSAVMKSAEKISNFLKKPVHAAYASQLSSTAFAEV